MGDKNRHQLLRVEVGDEASAWSSAGFTVVDDEVRIGSTIFRLVGAGSGRGLIGLAIDGVTESIDGLEISAPIPSFAPTITPVHSNLVTAVDHIVATSPDMDRTTAALVDAGLELRRERRFDLAGSANRQAFFWMGDVILELIGSDTSHGAGPAVWWGAAFTCADLSAAADLLGDRLGTPRPATQPGRDAATLRSDNLDMSVPIIFLSPHRGTGESVEVTAGGTQAG